jgi:hypothetical protein
VVSGGGENASNQHRLYVSKDNQFLKATCRWLKTHPLSKHLIMTKMEI